ncbi:nitroreductase [Chromatocurvus halotolerans]|uniref:Nitroreductase n=2 Tax=Chromatocurvus halotolerans TaxID=1132028 RepID=A0A4R2KYT7_9GAMM|nr:nitroreductase [Chromatocurvus halotolerans]
MFQAALRAPDHLWLRPWRFLVVEGERREALGRVMLDCLLRRDPEADETVRAKALNAPLRAPLLIVVLADITEHPKVPAVEQRLSAGCAAHAILLAAEALGYSGVWRTGNPAYDPEVVAALGGSRDEEITAFLYIGTREGTAKTLPAMSTDDFVARW